MSLEEDFNTTLKTLMRLRDAFEELTGKPDNAASQNALRMGEILREWREDHGIERLEWLAKQHEEKLKG